MIDIPNRLQTIRTGDSLGEPSKDFTECPYAQHGLGAGKERWLS